jgi:hypothetical protein
LISPHLTRVQQFLLSGCLTLLSYTNELCLYYNIKNWFRFKNNSCLLNKLKRWRLANLFYKS